MTDDERTAKARERFDELESHARTALNLLKNPEWMPTRLIWAQMAKRLLAAVQAAQAVHLYVTEDEWRAVTFAALEASISEAKEMTPEQARERLKAGGFMDENGNLAAAYGGPTP